MTTCEERFSVRNILESPAHPFTSDLDMDAAAPPLDLARAPLDVIAGVLQRMSLWERYTCALVCKAWAKAVTAATRSIILTDRVQDLSCLQRWLETHGGQVEVLQLHDCRKTGLTTLPCPQLENLLLHGSHTFDIDSRVWGDLAAATKPTSVSFAGVFTASQQAVVVSALTASPELQQLIWCCVQCSGEQQLSDSSLLQQLTKLTALQLEDVTAAALEHLGSLTKLQHLSVTAAEDWAAAGCPGLQELKALKSLKLHTGSNIPASVSQLTVLQQLDVSAATLTALNGLQVLPGLTQLCVHSVTGFSNASPPLELPGLQHLELYGRGGQMPVSLLSKCTQLQVLSLHYFATRSNALLALPGLTSLQLFGAADEQCRMLAQLTGLRELRVQHPRAFSVVGLRQLAALEQLTSLGFGSSFKNNRVSPVLQEQMTDRLLGYPRAIVNKVRASWVGGASRTQAAIGGRMGSAGYGWPCHVPRVPCRC